MWVYLKTAFLSIVENRDDPDSLLVRARIRGDIESVFPGIRAQRTADADYRYRASMPRDLVIAALSAEAEAIDYPNFKACVDDPAREALYTEVWAVTLQGAAAIDQYKQPKGK